MTLPLCSTRSAWKIKLLVAFHVLIVAMLWTLFADSTKIFWETIDVAFFKVINSTLEGRPWWQCFWAMANHKLADWVEDIVLLSLFAVYVKRTPAGQRIRSVAELLFSILYIAAIIYFVNKTLFREHLDIIRLSPTLSVDNPIVLSDEIHWMKIKDGSSNSFPGDHGTTALLFAASFTYFAGRRLGLWACLYAIFLCLPRLITGAHWLSDVIVGSGSITLFFLGWAFCTPGGPWIIGKLENLMRSFAFASYKKTR